MKQNERTNEWTNTRSQAVARIADRTASQHLWGSRDHLIAHRPFTIGGPLEPIESLTVSETFSGECDEMVDWP